MKKSTFIALGAVFSLAVSGCQEEEKEKEWMRADSTMERRQTDHGTMVMYMGAWYLLNRHNQFRPDDRENAYTGTAGSGGRMTFNRIGSSHSGNSSFTSRSGGFGSTGHGVSGGHSSFGG